MTLRERPATLASRLAALVQRLGLRGRGQRQLLEQASRLRLPFQPLALPRPSIWWQADPPLYNLPHLPRSALSGPVQEDKAHAHAVLVGVVDQELRQLDRFHLRHIDGLHGHACDLEPHASFEDYAASLPRRSVRIISYKDFVKAIGLALPRAACDQRICLQRADWRGERIFWAGDQHAEAFACAIAYARLRELDDAMPAQLNAYSLNPRGLARLDAEYHVLAMPAQAWSEPALMGLLVSNRLPYARLSLLRAPGAPEFLLLPKNNPEATALGEGLRLAGAPDVVQHFRQLATQTPGRQLL